MQARTYTDDAGTATDMQFREAPAELTDAEFEHAIADMPARARTRMREMRAEHELRTDRGIGVGVSGTTAGPGGIPMGAGVGVVAGVVGGVCAVFPHACVLLGIATARDEQEVAQITTTVALTELTGGVISAATRSPATRALVAADRELAASGAEARVSAGARGDGRCVAHACASATTAEGAAVAPSRVDDIWRRLGSEAPSSPTFGSLVERVERAINDLGIAARRIPMSGMANEAGGFVDGDYLILQREGANAHLVHGRARGGVMTIFDNEAPTISGAGHATLLGRDIGAVYVVE